MSNREDIVRRLDRNAVEHALAGLHEVFIKKTAEAIGLAKREALAEDIAINSIFIAMPRRSHGKQV